MKTIFFDFDGVIADSFSAAFATSKMLHPHLKEEDYRRRFDGNINEAVAKDVVIKEPRTNINFFEEYGPRLMKCPIFSGMKAVVERLSKDYQLIIVSSTITSLILEYLKMHDINSCFAEIMGNDVHKSKIAKIEMSLKKYDIKAADCIFITDTLGDIKEAHHVGIKTIAVSWGYHSKETLEKGSPWMIAEAPESILKGLTID